MRYTITIDGYIFAESDKEAVEKAKKLVKELDEKGVNLPAIISMYEAPFGSLEIREIKLIT